MLSKLSSRNIALIVIGATVLLALLWWSTLYRNGQTQLEDLNGEISNLELEKTKGLSAQANIGNLCSTVADLKVQQSAFLRALPRTEQFSKLLGDVRDRIATNAGQLATVQRSASPANATLPKGVKAINLNLGVEGSFNSFFGILSAIEKMQRFAKVDSVNVNLLGEPTSFNPTLSSQMNITTFVFDDPTVTLAPEEPDPLCQSVSGVPR